MGYEPIDLLLIHHRNSEKMVDEKGVDKSFSAAALPLGYIQINPDSWNRTNVCSLEVEVSLIYATSNGPMKLDSTNSMNFQLLPELSDFFEDLLLTKDIY